MTPSIDGDLLDQAEALLDAHPESDPITSSELGDALDLDDAEGNPKAREIVRIVVEERELPVAAGSKGYYRIENRDQLGDYLESLRGRAQSIQQRQRLTAKAWNRRHLAADGGERNV